MLPALRARLLPKDDALSRFDDATAAVAILLRGEGAIEVLLTERATRESDPWSGQWSFPGGRRQAGESLFETACRETEEEIGLSPRGSDVVGCLPARSPGNRQKMIVLPFVFHWTGGGEPRPGPEVASTAWVSLAELPKTRTTTTIHIRGREFEMPAFVSGSRTIWGFTYRLLEDLLEVLPSELRA